MNEIFRIHYEQKFNYHFDIFESNYLSRWIYLINYHLICIQTEKGITV